MEEMFYKTKKSVEQYIKSAEGFDGKLLIEKLKQILPIHSSLLEIGSGPGTDWNILNANYKVIGSDNSKQFINHLENNNPEGIFLELEASSLNTDIKFDGIYSNKVLHHLKDHELINSIERQNEILNTNGIICHSFWKGKGSEIFKGLFVNYHTEFSLKQLFEKHFEILHIDSYKEFEDNDSLLFIGRKME